VCHVAFFIFSAALISTGAWVDDAKADAPIHCTMTIGDAEIGCKNVTINDLDGAKAEVTAIYEKGFFRVVGSTHKNAGAGPTTITVIGIQKDSVDILPAEGACDVGGATGDKSAIYVSCSTYSAFGEVEIRSEHAEVKN